MPTKRSKPREPRRRKTAIEPIHVEELLAGAGMNGFLGILDTRVLTPHLTELIREAQSDAQVASVVTKVQALMELIEGAGNKFLR